MATNNPNDDIIAGLYNVEYYSSSQCAIYIGDTLIDEATSISYMVHQSRRPLYGYADQLFKAVSKGQVLVQGTFSINFKEAGYLFLVLDRYKQIMEGKESILGLGKVPRQNNNNSPFASSGLTSRENIESLVNNDGTFSTFERNRLLQALAANPSATIEGNGTSLAEVGAGLSGFAEISRAQNKIGGAENLFESFEDLVWQKPQEVLDNETRRPDDPRLNPFDIFVAYGDFAGTNKANHTIRKISQVTILGFQQQVTEDDTMPIQEIYSFIGRNVV